MIRKDAYTSHHHTAAASSAMDNSSISGLLGRIAIPLPVLLQQPNQHLRLWVQLHTITYILLLPRHRQPHGVSMFPAARPYQALCECPQSGVLFFLGLDGPTPANLIRLDCSIVLYPCQVLWLTAGFSRREEGGGGRRSMLGAWRCGLSVLRDRGGRGGWDHFAHCCQQSCPQSINKSVVEFEFH